jgi:predicted alpha/beta hydrolase family esterase
MKKKIQVLFIHGGMTFKSYKDYLAYLKNRPVRLTDYITWSGDYLDKKLGSSFEIIRPKMPLKENSKYEEWKIVFETYLPYLKGKFILIGSSLGGIFLSKYLSENKLPKKALSVFMVCPPFDNTCSDEDLAGGFRLKKDLSKIYDNAKTIHLMFSHDDDCVPVCHADKYKNKLPKANIYIYKEKKGHFKVSEFPEIIKIIKNIVK